MKDMFGTEIKVGQLVLKPKLYGRSTPLIEKRWVTRINEQEGKLYLDDSKVSINFPERLVIYQEV